MAFNIYRQILMSVYTHICQSESVGHSVMSDSLQHYGLQPTSLLYPWDSPVKNTGVGSSYSLLQGIFPTQG